jgi:hypothetical protein
VTTTPGGHPSRFRPAVEGPHRPGRLCRPGGSHASTHRLQRRVLIGRRYPGICHSVNPSFEGSENRPHCHEAWPAGRGSRQVRLAGQGARSPGGGSGEVIGGLLAGDTTAAHGRRPVGRLSVGIVQPLALRRSALAGSLRVPSPHAMNELRTGCPSRSGRAARVQVRPLGLPGPGHHRVTVGGRRRGVQRGAPAHVTDRHAAGAVGTGRPAHGMRRCRPDVLPRLHPRHPARPARVASSGSAPGAPLHPGCAGPGQVSAYDSKSLSTLGKAAFGGIRAYAEQHNIEIEGLPEDPKAEIPPEQALHMVQTSLRSNSPGYIPPLRVRVPQAPPYSGCASVAPSRSASVRSTDDPSPSETGVLLARSSVILVRGGHADLR